MNSLTPPLANIPPLRRPRRPSLTKGTLKTATSLPPERRMVQKSATSTTALSKMFRVINVWRDFSLRNKNSDRKLRCSSSLDYKKHRVVFRPPVHPVQSDDPEVLLHDVYVEEMEFDPSEAVLTLWDESFETIDHDDIPWYEQDYKELPWWEYPDLDEDDELTAHCKEVVRESLLEGNNRAIYTEKRLQAHVDRVEALVFSFVLKLRNRALFTQLQREFQQQELEISQAGIPTDLEDISLGGDGNINQGVEEEWHGSRSSLGQEPNLPLQPFNTPSIPVNDDQKAIMHKLLNPSPLRNTKPKITKEDVAKMVLPRRRKTPRRTRSGNSQQSHSVLDDDSVSLHSAALSTGWNRLNIHNSEMRRYHKSHRKTSRRIPAINGARGLWADDHTVMIDTSNHGGDDDGKSVASFQSSPAMLEYTKTRQSWMHFDPNRKQRREPKKLFKLTTSATGTVTDVMSQSEHTTDTASTAATTASGRKKKKKKKKKVGHLAMFMAKEELKGGQGNIFDILEEEQEEPFLFGNAAEPRQRASEPIQKSSLSFFWAPNREEDQPHPNDSEEDNSNNNINGETHLNDSVSFLQDSFKDGDLYLNDSNNRLEDSYNNSDAYMNNSDNCLQENLNDNDSDAIMNNSDNCLQENPNDSDAIMNNSNNCLEENLNDSDNCLQENFNDNVNNHWNTSGNCVPENCKDIDTNLNGATKSNSYLQNNSNDSDNCLRQGANVGNQDRREYSLAQDSRSDDNKSNSGCGDSVGSNSSSSSSSSSSSGTSSIVKDGGNDKNTEKGGDIGKIVDVVGGATKNGDSSSSLDRTSGGTEVAQNLSKMTTAKISPVPDRKVPSSPTRPMENGAKAKVETLPASSASIKAEYNGVKSRWTNAVPVSELKGGAVKKGAPEVPKAERKPVIAKQTIGKDSKTETIAQPIPLKKRATRRASSSGIGLFSIQLPQTERRGLTGAMSTSSKGSKARDDSTGSSSSAKKRPPAKRNQLKPLITRRASFSDIQFSVPNSVNDATQSPRKASMNEDDPKLRLVMLRHAALCTQTQSGAVCPSDPKCSQMKELLRHMMKCKHQSTMVPCNFQGCHESKTFLLVMHKTSQILARQQEAERDLPPVVCIPASSADLSIGKKNEHAADDDDLSEMGSFGSAGGGMGNGINDGGAVNQSGQTQDNGRSPQLVTVGGRNGMHARPSWVGGIAKRGGDAKPVLKDKALIEKVKKEEEEREKIQADLKKRHEAVKARIQAKIKDAQKQEVDNKATIRQASVARRSSEMPVVVKSESALVRRTSDAQVGMTARQGRAESNIATAAVPQAQPACFSKDSPAEQVELPLGRAESSKATAVPQEQAVGFSKVSPAVQAEFTEQEKLRRKHEELKARLLQKSKLEQAEEPAVSAAVPQNRPTRRKSLPANPGRLLFRSATNALPSNPDRKPAAPLTIERVLSGGKSRGPPSASMDVPVCKPMRKSITKSQSVTPATSNTSKMVPRKSITKSLTPTKKTDTKQGNETAADKRLVSEIVYDHQVEATSEVERLKAAKVAKKVNKEKKRLSMIY